MRVVPDNHICITNRKAKAGSLTASCLLLLLITNYSKKYYILKRNWF